MTDASLTASSNNRQRRQLTPILCRPSIRTDLFSRPASSIFSKAPTQYVRNNSSKRRMGYLRHLTSADEALRLATSNIAFTTPIPLHSHQLIPFPIPFSASSRFIVIHASVWKPIPIFSCVTFQ